MCGPRVAEEGVRNAATELSSPVVAGIYLLILGEGFGRDDQVILNEEWLEALFA